ncbi:MAG: glycosyltransferase, partial [Rhodothermales bacterium]
GIAEGRLLAAWQFSQMPRVLFVTYYYPPSGGPGVQRSLKFTKYLPEFGWTPDVLTVRPEHASYPDLDPDLGSDIRPDIHVERTSAWDPYAMYARVLGREKKDVVSVGFLGEAHMNARQRAARWIRANLFLPDARVGWVPYAVARGHRLLRERDHDVILTTGPPHSTHLVGLMLSALHKKPWLVDFRDPWTEIDYYAELPMSSLAQSADAALERLVLRRATAGTVVSEAMRRQLPRTASLRLEVIENGFDPADFQGLRAVPPADRFEIAHIGNLNAARNPTALWRALSVLRKEMPELRVVMIGNVEPAVLTTAAAYGLDDLIENLPYVPHDAAIRHMMQSTLLLLSINRVKGAGGIVTGKAYEYVASGRPVLGIGPVDG